MLTRPLEQISASHLHALCTDRVPESRFLEFKRELPGAKDKDRFEFVKDVAAFANAEGGDIIYGIEEEAGVASKVTPVINELADHIILRLKQILDSALEPRLNDIEIQCISVDGGIVTIVRIPPNTIGPFRVIQNSNSRFVVRDINYVRDMTFSEIRSAFSADRDFRSLVLKEQQRVAQTMIDGSTWRPLLEGPALAFQIIPFSTTSGRNNFDIIKSFDGQYMMMPSWGGCSSAINLDGMLFYTGSEKEVYSYNLARRNGIFETFTFSGYSFSDAKIIPALSLAQDVREAAHEFTRHYSRIQIGGPAALTLSLVGTLGRKLEMGSRYFRSAPIGDRDLMLMPPIYLDNLMDKEKLDPSLKSLMDITWQALGVHSCPYFDSDGAWLNPN